MNACLKFKSLKYRSSELEIEAPPRELPVLVTGVVALEGLPRAAQAGPSPRSVVHQVPTITLGTARTVLLQG